MLYLLALSLLILLLPGEGTRVGLGALAVFGLALAIAAAPILRQFMAGLSLAFLGSHRFGSRVFWQGREATLLRGRLFHSIVRLRDGRRCLVPNQEIISSAVLPADGAQERRAYDLRLAVGEGSDEKLLKDLADWAAEFGDGASTRLAAIEDGTLQVKLLVPTLVAADDRFVSRAYAGIRELAARSRSRLVSLRPDA